ncbi:MAG: oxidoreductase [Verrucomicrobia bacterium Tous-C9LFEB]|nr:MAG: oxidoreductase [Verrucomicrobia bacterium Tous-C9LFEB]
MSKLKVGVVGVGHIGREHARIYSQVPNAEFVGVFDQDPEQCRRIATQYNIKPFTSIDEVANECEAVTIATPTNTHHTLGLHLLDKGRHLLIEKPIADDTAKARDLVQKAKDKGLVLQVGHIERFNPALRALEGMLTRPKFIEAHRLSPYPGRSTDIGVVLDLMIHDLEIVLHLVKSPIVSVDSVGVAVLSKGEDIANARLRFENGCVANLTTSRISPEKLRKIRVFQDDTYLSLDYQGQSGEIYRKVQTQITREKIKVEKDEPLKLEVASFVDCILTKNSPVVSGAQAAAALEVAMKITDQIWANNAAK